MNRNQVNDTVFEALFRQVIIDKFNEEIDSIPSNEQLSEKYSFSPEFEIRMKKLFEKDRRENFIKTSMTYSRRVASILIIILGLMFSTLLFNTGVRAAVGKVLVEWYEKFTSFTFRDDEVINEIKDWNLKYLPEGYIQNKYEVLGRITNIEFKNNEGDKIRFFYRPENSIINISVDNENHEIDSCLVLGNVGYSISAIKKEFDNGIIWNMDDHTFNLWGKLSRDELKKMAEAILEK